MRAGRATGTATEGSFAKVMHAQGEQGEKGKARKKTGERAQEEERLDPMLAQCAMWSPPTAGAMVSPVAPAERQARSSLEDLLPALVRRIAWSGDARSGTVRLELGAGALSGATLVVQADEGRVRVQLNAPAGTNPAEWRARIEERLARRGLRVDGVEVE
jgi:hypothetical protein